MTGLGTPEIDAWQTLIDILDDVPEDNEPAYIEDMMESRLSAELEAERDARRYGEGRVEHDGQNNIGSHSGCAC